MTRHRWLQAEWHSSIRTLAKRFRQHTFSDGAQSGFIIDRLRDELLEARYVERYEFQETVADPFGQEVKFDRLEYRQTAFRATPGWPGLELVDAPRSAQTLVNELLEATDFSVAIVPIGVDVLRWASALQDELGVGAAFTSAQVGALRLADGVLAKAVLRGAGDGDVRAACDALTNGRPHVLEKLQFKIRRGGNVTTVLLANNATAKVEAREPPNDLLAAIGCTLPRQL